MSLMGPWVGTLGTACTSNNVIIILSFICNFVELSSVTKMRRRMTVILLHCHAMVDLHSKINLKKIILDQL